MGLKNLLLCPCALQRPCCLRLINLLLHAAAVALRERARSIIAATCIEMLLAPRTTPLPQIGDRGGGGSPQIDAPMLEEALVFGGQHRLNQCR